MKPEERVNYHTEREKTLKRRAAYIKADIEERGIEMVLADIVTEPVMYCIRS